jgi:hypothetical protein
MRAAIAFWEYYGILILAEKRIGLLEYAKVYYLADILAQETARNMHGSNGLPLTINREMSLCPGLTRLKGLEWREVGDYYHMKPLF